MSTLDMIVRTIRTSPDYLGSMLMMITLDINQDRLNASITTEEKNPYQFGTLDKGFRVKSALNARRGLKSSGSTRSVNRTRNTLECKST